MNLKEAFRYQNKIQALMCEAENILRNRANITKVTNTNLRHKVMPEASDETVVEIPETEYCGKITDVALFLVFLLEEKSVLAAAIRRAKNNLDIDMDSEVALLSLYPTHAAPNIFVFCRFRHRSPGFIRRHSGNIFPTRRKIDHAASDF